MESHKHPERKPFKKKKTCKYFHEEAVWRTHRGSKANLVAPILTLQRGMSNVICALTRVVSLPPECSARRGHYWQSWRPDQRTPMRENTTTMTHTSNHVLSRSEIHKHTKHKPLSCKRSAPTWRCGHHIVAPQNNSQLRARILALQRCSRQYKWATTLVVSLPPQFTRVGRKCCRSWRLDQPLQCDLKFNNDTNQLMYSSERKITDGLGINTFLYKPNIVATTP